jgi:hypothetical protein
MLAAVSAVLLQACAGKVDVKAKADDARAALNATDTRDQFIRIAESHGFDCKGSTVSVAHCWWTEPDRGLFNGITWGAISAHGEFVDGRKSGEYEVKDVYTGP